MELTLDGITKKVGRQSWLYRMSLSPRPREVTVLLGATQSGKTSLMRIMAGLDTPSLGCVRVDGEDVTWTQGQGGPTYVYRHVVRFAPR